ncbi:hypothetical protein F5Y17DRAFT_372934 [Xylariaceae sp. FL0594]|nr:hypothetical protein F5Y17DRAFT_372934 [Xylariaceae sp. FL0594]
MQAPTSAEPSKAPKAPAKGESSTGPALIDRPSQAQRGMKGQDDRRVQRGKDKNLPATQAGQLSVKCQTYGFNPKWNDTSTTQGIRYNVQLMNKVIRADRFYQTHNEAKQAVSTKALEYLNSLQDQLPDKVAVCRALAKSCSSGTANRPKEVERSGSTKTKEQLVLPVSFPVPASDERSTRRTRAANIVAHEGTFNTGNEQGEFSEQVRSILGGHGPSEAVLADPLACQAFLQGLCLRTVVHPTTARPTMVRLGRLQDRGDATLSNDRRHPWGDRERSPTRVSRPYKERSPIRRRGN